MSQEQRDDKKGEDQRRQIVFDWVQKTTDESRPWESCVDELLSALDRVVPSAVAALDDPAFAMRFYQEVIDWNRRSNKPLIKISYESEVAGAVQAILDRLRGVPSAIERRSVELLELIVKGYVEWEDTGDSSTMIKLINEADVHLNERRTADRTISKCSEGDK